MNLKIVIHDVLVTISKTRVLLSVPKINVDAIFIFLIKMKNIGIF